MAAMRRQSWSSTEGSSDAAGTYYSAAEAGPSTSALALAPPRPLRSTPTSRTGSPASRTPRAITTLPADVDTYEEESSLPWAQPKPSTSQLDLSLSLPGSSSYKPQTKPGIITSQAPTAAIALQTPIQGPSRHPRSLTRPSPSHSPALGARGSATRLPLQPSPSQSKKTPPSQPEPLQVHSLGVSVASPATPTAARHAPPAVGPRSPYRFHPPTASTPSLPRLPTSPDTTQTPPLSLRARRPSNPTLPSPSFKSTIASPSPTSASEMKRLMSKPAALVSPTTPSGSASAGGLLSATSSSIDSMGTSVLASMRDDFMSAGWSPDTPLSALVVSPTSGGKNESVGTGPGDKRNTGTSSGAQRGRRPSAAAESTSTSSTAPAAPARSRAMTYGAPAASNHANSIAPFPVSSSVQSTSLASEAARGRSDFDSTAAMIRRSTDATDKAGDGQLPPLVHQRSARSLRPESSPQPSQSRALTPASAIALAYQQQHGISSTSLHAPPSSGGGGGSTFSRRPSPSPSIQPSSSSSLSSAHRNHHHRPHTEPVPSVGSLPGSSHPSSSRSRSRTSSSVGIGGGPGVPISTPPHTGPNTPPPLAIPSRRSSEGLVRKLSRKISGKLGGGAGATSGGTPPGSRPGTAPSSRRSTHKSSAAADEEAMPSSYASTNSGLAAVGSPSWVDEDGRRLRQFDFDNLDTQSSDSHQPRAVYPTNPMQSISQPQVSGQSYGQSSYDQEFAGFGGSHHHIPLTSPGLSDSHSQVRPAQPLNPPSSTSHPQQSQSRSKLRTSKSKSLLRLTSSSSTATTSTSSTTATSAPPTPSATSPDSPSAGVGGSIWRLVKKFSSSTLRRSDLQAMSATGDSIPPVPKLPVGARTSATGGKRRGSGMGVGSDDGEEEDYGSVVQGKEFGFGSYGYASSGVSGSNMRNRFGSGAGVSSGDGTRPPRASTTTANTSLTGRSRSGTVVSSVTSASVAISTSQWPRPPPPPVPIQQQHKHKRSLSQSRTVATGTSAGVLSSSPSDISSSRHFWRGPGTIGTANSPRTSTSSYFYSTGPGQKGGNGGSGAGSAGIVVPSSLDDASGGSWKDHAELGFAAFDEGEAGPPPKGMVPSPRTHVLNPDFGFGSRRSVSRERGSERERLEQHPHSQPSSPLPPPHPSTPPFSLRTSMSISNRPASITNKSAVSTSGRGSLLPSLPMLADRDKDKDKSSPPGASKKSGSGMFGRIGRSKSEAQVVTVGGGVSGGGSLRSPVRFDLVPSLPHTPSSPAGTLSSSMDVKSIGVQPPRAAPPVPLSPSASFSAAPLSPLSPLSMKPGISTPIASPTSLKTLRGNSNIPHPLVLSPTTPRATASNVNSPLLSPTSKRWSYDERRDSADSGKQPLSPTAATLYSPTAASSSRPGPYHRAASFDSPVSQRLSVNTSGSSGSNGAGNSGATVAFRELTGSSVVKRTEDEKVAMWDRLMERSEKAGGTLKARIDESLY